MRNLELFCVGDEGRTFRLALLVMARPRPGPAPSPSLTFTTTRAASYKVQCITELDTQTSFRPTAAAAAAAAAAVSSRYERARAAPGLRWHTGIGATIAKHAGADPQFRPTPLPPLTPIAAPDCL